MSDKKQIEEMARKMCRNYQPNGSCASDDDPCHLECVYGYCAERIYCAGYRKQEWISVDERLPDEDIRVLVYINSDRIYTNIDTDRFSKGTWVRWYKDVTHWMPLPEPPKGE